MTKIRIDTERVRASGQRFLAIENQLEQVTYDLQRAMDSLDTWAWDGRSRFRAEPLLSQVHPTGRRVTDELERLGRMLHRVADTFESEDNTAARNLEGMPWVDWSKSGQESPGVLIDNTDFRFVDGASLTDIEQGAVGNCYMIAAMGAVAYQRPDLIERAIKLNEDGTYTITFYDTAGNPVEITITDDFPKPKKGKSFAKSKQDNELWVPLIEKAFVKWHTGGVSSKDYEKIAGGRPGDIMRALTGNKVTRLNIRKSSIDELGRDIQTAIAAGKPVTVGIKPTFSQALNSTIDPLVRDEWVDYTHGVLLQTELEKSLL